MLQPTPDFLPIDFIVGRGAISGLTAAIALSRVGHRVTVLETPMGAGCRIPPNASKLFCRWGMGERLRKCSVKSRGVLFVQYSSGSMVGSHKWEEDYSDLSRILAESAAEHGAVFRGGCQVVSVEPDSQRPYVTLAMGEVITGDVMIGADGCHVPPYHCRSPLVKKTGRSQWECNCSKLDPQKEPMTGEPLFMLFVYAAYKEKDLFIGHAGREQLLQSLQGGDPRLLQLAQHAQGIICIPMIERPFLEDWVHLRGRLIAIGEAAHPIPVSFHANHLSLVGRVVIGMAAGDAAVLGRLISHLRRKYQIGSFLNAIPEIRAGRVERVLHAAAGNIFAVSLPPGVAEARDRALRERAERGIQELVARKGSLGGLWAERSAEMRQAIEKTFAYDPEDEADNWWVQWGLMQERAARMVISDAVTVYVNEDLQEESD
ncbi:FAD/NAD(P)-binding domain-containing protein [Cubamyces sp. BRFM 1775]|nr:FAD/NAD(P)-binding domain-containing protein [Cubamyces sp. BRFM 1775]